MSVLVLIPARGGSKRLPGKNLRWVGGRSLVAHAVRCGLEFLREANLSGAVMCDTDCKLIASEARVHGANVPWLREPDFARDRTKSAATVERTLERLAVADRSYAAIVLLQPTSPLRTVEDVIDVWRAEGAARLSVNDATGEPNGAAYAIEAAELRAEGTFEPPHATLVSMPPERSIDINTVEDLAEAERLWRLQHG